MPLTQRQAAQVQALPVRQRAAARRNFLNQNRVQNGGGNFNRSLNPRRQNNSRGRGRRNFNSRPRQRNTIRQNVRSSNNRAPAALGHTVERRQSTNLTQEVTFYIDTFNIPKQTSLMTAQVIDITPSNIPWLDKLSELYGRYKFLNYRYRFVTAESTNARGNVWAAFQPISTANLPSTLNDIQQFGQHKLGPLYKTWDMFISVDPKLLKERWFRTGRIQQDNTGVIPDFADLFPGRILFGTVGVNAEAQGGVLGWLEIHAVVQFSDRHTAKLGQQTLPPPEPTDIILYDLKTTGNDIVGKTPNFFADVVDDFEDLFTSRYFLNGKPARSDNSVSVKLAFNPTDTMKSIRIATTSPEGSLQVFFATNLLCEMTVGEDPTMLVTLKINNRTELVVTQSWNAFPSVNEPQGPIISQSVSQRSIDLLANAISSLNISNEENSSVDIVEIEEE